MGLQQLEHEVTRLSPSDLREFARWLEEYLADAWDRKIEADILAGKLDAAGARADAAFEAGQCKPL